MLIVPDPRPIYKHHSPPPSAPAALPPPIFVVFPTCFRHTVRTRFLGLLTLQSSNPSSSESAATLTPSPNNYQTATTMPPKKTESAAPKAKAPSTHASYQVGRPDSGFLQAAGGSNALQDMITDAIVGVIAPVPVLPAHLLSSWWGRAAAVCIMAVWPPIGRDPHHCCHHAPPLLVSRLKINCADASDSATAQGQKRIEVGSFYYPRPHPSFSGVATPLSERGCLEAIRTFYPRN